MRYSFLIFCFLFSLTSNAQDVIFKRNGESIQVKVIEVSKKEIKYKKFINLNGPDYKMYIEDIDKVVYESGAEDYFNGPSKSASKESLSDKVRVNPDELGNNIIMLNVIDILFQNVTVSYERLFGDERKLGLRVPISASLYGNNLNDITFNSYNVFYSGLDLNFYPVGQRQASFYIGPSIRMGSARFVSQNQGINYYDYSSYITTGSYASLLFQGGFVWNPVKELSISSSFGLGSRRYFTSSPNNRNTVTTGSFWFAFGYRF